MKRPSLVAVLLVAVSAGGAAAAPPSALQAKRAQAQAVMAQVNALDVEFGKVVDEWDGARLSLAAARKQLAANAVSLARAQRRSRIAERRRDRRLVQIYETGRPDVVQLLAGAGSLSELIDLAQYSRDVAASDRSVADEAPGRGRGSPLRTRRCTPPSVRGAPRSPRSPRSVHGSTDCSVRAARCSPRSSRRSSC